MKAAIYIPGVLIIAMLALMGCAKPVCEESMDLGKEVSYGGNMDALWGVLNDLADGTVVRITFSVDGAKIPNSANMRLMGDADSQWNIGDGLPLYKFNGVWYEMSRYLGD